MNDDVHALLGAYALGAVTADERASFEAHLASCAACAEEVASFDGVVASFADAEAAPPPASLRAGVMAAISAVPQVVPEPSVTSVAEARERRAARRWPRLVIAAASLLVLAGVGVVAASAWQSRQQTLAMEHDVMMVTTAPDAHSMPLALGTSHLVMSDSMGAVVAMGQDAPMPSDGMEYQVFLMMEDGSSVAGPVFVPSADGDFMTIMSAPMDGVVGVAVTEEPMGGSTEMTGDMVAVVHL